MSISAAADELIGFLGMEPHNSSKTVPPKAEAHTVLLCGVLPCSTSGFFGMASEWRGGCFLAAFSLVVYIPCAVLFRASLYLPTNKAFGQGQGFLQHGQYWYASLQLVLAVFFPVLLFRFDIDDCFGKRSQGQCFSDTRRRIGISPLF